jgi:hypothetical protein
VNRWKLRSTNRWRWNCTPHAARHDRLGIQGGDYGTLLDELACAEAALLINTGALLELRKVLCRTEVKVQYCGEVIASAADADESVARAQCVLKAWASKAI